MRLPTYVRTHLCTYVRKAYVRTYVRMYCFAYVRTYVMDCGADPVSLTYVRTIPSRRPRWRRGSPTMPSRGKQQLGATVQVATSAANAARASLMPCSALKHDAVPHHSVQAMVRHGVAWEEWPAPAAAAYVRKSVQVSPPLLSQFWSMPRTRQARDRSAFLAAAPLSALAQLPHVSAAILFSHIKTRY